MDYLLPSSVYQSPPRLGRGRQLNTILEVSEEMSVRMASDSEDTGSDRTITARPAGLDTKLRALSLKTKLRYGYPSSPVSVVSSADGDDKQSRSSRSSYAGSDAGTVFSDSCPSLAGSNTSDSTSFATESNRTSFASRSSRNKYPTILIPRDSWGSVEGEIKQVSFGMSPSTKILLSPEVLRSLPQYVPGIDEAPSLADTGSIRSESPCIPTLRSAPVTPDMHNLAVSEGQPWGGHAQIPATPLEIAIDEHHSILLSPAEAHSNGHSRSQSDAWSEIMGNFPVIPGATPQELTPITPVIPRNERFNSVPSDFGSQLPPMALEVLRGLTRAASPSFKSESSVEEMQERTTHRKPRSVSGETPISEHSFSQMSIPSPGGFFASLQTGARHTWASPPARETTPPPSSTTAENFYNTPWTGAGNIVETVLSAPDDGSDGPPTVKQATFDPQVKTPIEDPDMYSGSAPTEMDTQNTSEESAYEYDEAYEAGLKMAAEANIDRTGSWLAAQTTYLSALRETNPLNDPSDYPVSAGPITEDEERRKSSFESETQKAMRFLDEANKAAKTPVIGKAPSLSATSSPTREPLFLEAFNFTRSTGKRSDAFLQASARLQSVQTTRIALPKLHIKSLLNDHSSSTLTPQHSRPKYRGPFSQNPRATGVFEPVDDQDLYARAERQQLALAAILPNTWTVEAQSKILFNDRLLACNTTSERLTQRSKQVGAKRVRILDLGGNSTASWAWAAATKWTNAKIITVQSKAQTQFCQPQQVNQEPAVKPLNPENHRVVTVPQFWQLPFKTGYFDVISARTLHMYLRSTPVPGVSSIDEWDMTLKECMRVLKPGGILDYFVMDSGSNDLSMSSSNAISLSPNAMTSSNASATTATSSSKRKADGTCTEFRTELSRRGYEIDGGCGRLMTRLKKEGFVGVRRQWIGMPMGRSEDTTLSTKSPHSRKASEASLRSIRSATSVTVQGQEASCSYKTYFNADGSRKPFRLAPRPISEVSTISKIVEQYANCEAVQGPIGSTQDVSDMSSLLGELLWEEWLVRLRIEAGVKEEHLLAGVNDVFEEWRRNGRAAWRGVVGWARKPSKKEAQEIRDKQWKEQGRVPSPVERISVGLAIDMQPQPRPQQQQPEMVMQPSTLSQDLRIDTTNGTMVYNNNTNKTYHQPQYQTPQYQPQQYQPQQYQPQQYQPQQYQQTQQARHYEFVSPATAAAAARRSHYTNTHGPSRGLQRNESVFSQREFSQSAIERGDVAEIPFVLMG